MSEVKTSIEYDPPVWAPYAVASAQGWRHPVTKELLVAIPGGVKTRQQSEQVVETVINESPVAATVIVETEPVVEVISEIVSETPTIVEAPAVEVVIQEVVKPEVKETVAQPVKTPAKRGPKPKAKAE